MEFEVTVKLSREERRVLRRASAALTIGFPEPRAAEDEAFVRAVNHLDGGAANRLQLDRARVALGVTLAKCKEQSDATYWVERAREEGLEIGREGETEAERLANPMPAMVPVLTAARARSAEEVEEALRLLSKAAVSLAEREEAPVEA